MKTFIKEYLKIITYAVTGLVLVLTSFYLIMNYYHSEEVKGTIYINKNDLNLQNYNNKLEQIQTNLNNFKSKKVENNNYKVMYNKLLTCQTVLTSEGTLAKIPTNNTFSAYDIYKLGTKIQNDLLNLCWALHLSYLTTENLPKEFTEIAPYVINQINSIVDQTSFAIKDLQNNSSYFYTTDVTSSTVRNYLQADYQILAKSYNEFADIILNLSKKINEDDI